MPLLSLLLYAFVTSFTPGPNNIMALSFANRFGLQKTSRFCLGVGTGFFVILLMSCYFNLLLKSVVPKIEMVMTFVGAAYMLYLAIKIVTSTKKDQDKKDDKNNSFIAGVFLQFINPKGVLYGITVISIFILPYHTSTVGLLFYSIALAFVGFLATFSWTVFGSVFKRFLAKYRTQFNIVMALLLVYSAVSIFFE